MDLRNMFEFGSVNSEDYGVYVLDVVTKRHTKRRMNFEPVDGKNGDLLIDNGAYENVDVSVVCAIIENAEDRLLALNAALLAETGYNKLSHTLDSEHYRIGVFMGEIEPRLSRRGDLTVVSLTFNCKPQRWLSSSQSNEFSGGDSDYSIAEYSDFSTGFKNGLSYWASHIGITDAELQAMKYIVWNLPPHLMDEGDRCYFAGSLPDKYFRMETRSADPFTATSVTIYGRFSTEREVVATQESAIYGYIIQPYQFNADFFVNGVRYEPTTQYNIINFYAHGDLYNPTPNRAKPIIKVDIGGADVHGYVCGINNCGVYFDAPSTNNVDILTIDAETLNAYCLPEESLTGELINCNGMVYFTEREMYLNAGHNEILTSDLTDGITIEPRWWTL